MPKTFIFIGLQFLVTKCMTNNTFSHDCADQWYITFQVYVNSFIAFLNARYYMQANVIVDSPQLYERHGVYHPELHVSASQDGEFQKSQKDPKDDVLHIPQTVQAAMVGGYVIVDGRELMETLSHSCRHRQRK
jgi:hypothetical protein